MLNLSKIHMYLNKNNLVNFMLDEMNNLYNQVFYLTSIKKG